MGIPVDEDIPWDEGKHHQIGWALLIFLLSLGFVMNFTQVIVHITIPKLWKLPNAPTITAIAVQEGLFDLCCVITCISSMAQKQYSGEASCVWQATYSEFLMAWNGMSVCSLYYSCYVNIVEGRTLTSKEVLKAQGLFGCYSTLLTVLGVLYPGRPKLNSSGLFCYTAFYLLPEGITFYIGFVFPMFLALVYMNIKLERGLKQMKETMKEFGLTIQPRPFQLNNLRSMRVYIGVMLLLYSPILLVSFYAWITGYHAPPSLWILTGLMGHSNTVINPILYYLLSTSARKHLAKTIFRIFPCFTCLLSEIDEKETITDHIAYAAYFDVLLTSPAGVEILKKEAEKCHCPELTKFYLEDHPAWLALCFRDNEKRASSMGLAVSKTPEKSGRNLPIVKEESDGGLSRSVSKIVLGIDADGSDGLGVGIGRSSSGCPPSSPTKGTPALSSSQPSTATTVTFIELADQSCRSPEASQIEPLIADQKIDKMAIYIYRTYIEDKAPLSLNITDSLRQDIEERLYGYGGTQVVASQDKDPSTMFAEVEKIVKDLIFANLYRRAYHSKEVMEEFSAHQRVMESSNKGPL